MRLIDADKLIKDIKQLWDYKTVDDITATTVLKQTITDIENQPTVEAIPIRWIQHYTKEHSMYGAIDDVFVVLHTMLCEWERENETNRCG